MRKIIIWILMFIVFMSNLFAEITYSAMPKVNCAGLPWCNSDDIMSTSWDSLDEEIWKNFISNIIWEFIKLVAVFAVFALIFSWVMYLLSSWDEEKANKAKKWIIWSLVWVFLSISAWGIINFLNNVNIW